MSAVGVVTGSRLEARCLPEGVAVACSGADPAQARRAAEGLVGDGIAGLVSFGFGAGLDPDLRIGELVLADAVLAPAGGRVAVAPAWRRRLGRTLEQGGIAFRSGAVAGCDRLLATAADKAALRRATGALAADMESHAVAAVATAAGLPFVVIRAISDTAAQALPGRASGVLAADGHVRPTVVAGILARPFELAALIRLGLSTRRALRTLRQVAVSAGNVLAVSPRAADSGS